MPTIINDRLGDRTLKNKLTTILPLFLLAIGAIGSVTSANAGLIDSIYVPLDAPCRVGDTRGTLNPTIPADGYVEWDAYGVDMSSQGGESTGCPQPKIGKTPTGIAVNITAVGNLATAKGNLVAYAADAPAPTNSVVNYTPGTNIANSTIVGLGPDGKFIIQSNFAEVPAIADVQGYFYAQTGGNGHIPGVPGEDFSYVGFWSGRMLYDRGYSGSNTCYDADVTINIGTGYIASYSINSIIFRRDVGGMEIWDMSQANFGDIHQGYVVSRFVAFNVDSNFTLQFYNNATADGAWSDSYGSDCYGTWSFTKD